MTKVGTRAIYFTGSRKRVNRTVQKDAEGFWVKWYGQMIRVTQSENDETATAGWQTVEQY